LQRRRLLNRVNASTRTFGLTETSFTRMLHSEVNNHRFSVQDKSAAR